MKYGWVGLRSVPALHSYKPWREEGRKKKTTVKVTASPQKISVQRLKYVPRK